jgi:hypothetical protein
MKIFILAKKIIGDAGVGTCFPNGEWHADTFDRTVPTHLPVPIWGAEVDMLLQL